MFITAFVSLACNIFNLVALGHMPLPCLKKKGAEGHEEENFMDSVMSIYKPHGGHSCSGHGHSHGGHSHGHSEHLHHDHSEHKHHDHTEHKDHGHSEHKHEKGHKCDHDHGHEKHEHKSDQFKI